MENSPPMGGVHPAGELVGSSPTKASFGRVPSILRGDIYPDTGGEHGIQEGQRLNEQQNQDFFERLARLREDNESQQLLQKERRAQSKIVLKYKIPDDRYGYVWVYLRSPAGPTIMEADAQRSQQ